ncbi:guanylatebinding protein [Plasmopara halstedii]|uniref:Guanylatebinding protein n=1 Tax=Plasmopara halstedii TaxID=4781 RepID=A0A0P1AG44_PLAHL|nr:guanylatebinding protein [Plasmopara halstedii]CEG40002.1 guanylatebinding protein [Plasmopara halstedii]|eukprot:XP_024576371.1 guanylatebinding protein [Plasmopara halstedii]
MPFVLVDEDGGFQINPDARAMLEKVKTRIVVIAVAGLYRTGKSFLLNLLVQGVLKSTTTNSSRVGFAVGGTVNACTKGIWIWGAPIPLDGDTSVIFLDTEGLGSVNREQTHDTRIFALALLLASNFVYNSRGVIDGNAIEDLSLVVNLSKHIQTSSSKETLGNADRLHEYFPSFMWIVRDFTLQLLDNGKPITSKQYLENALQPTGGYSDDSIKKDQIRALLSSFFRHRDCVTLVRPVDDEQKLRNLPQVAYDELRDEFRSSFESLHKRLFSKIQPKTMFGKPINGAMFVNLAGSYVEALNSGKTPVISSAWSRVVQAQCHDALEEAVERYKAELRARLRSYVSPQQYEEDAEFEVDCEVEQDTEKKVMSSGMNNAVFDEFGNLQFLAMRHEFESDESTEADLTALENRLIAVVGIDDVTEAPCNDVRTRLPCSDVKLKKVHRLCKRLAKKKLREILDEDFSVEIESGNDHDYMTQFYARVNAEFEKYRQQNAAASMAYCRHLLNGAYDSKSKHLVHSDQLQSRSAMDLFRETQVYLQEELDAMHEKYIAYAVGPSADAAYCEYISQRVLSQIIQRTESTNAAHMAEVRALEKQMNDLSVKVAVAHGQEGAMQELSAQQHEKCKLGIKEAEQRCAVELAGLRSTLEFKTNELEHILNHNATMKRLADTAQQGQYRATEFASSAFTQILCGYLIKQHMAPGANGSARAKWQQRYFVLQGPQLSFYDTKEDYERCRSDNPLMDVTGAVIEDNFAVPEAFSISFRDDKYYPLQLHAKSVEVKQEWVLSLRAAAARFATQDGLRSLATSSSSSDMCSSAEGSRYKQM